MWITCWWLSLAVLVAAAGGMALAICRKSSRIKPLYILLGGVFLSAAVLIFPIYRDGFDGDLGAAVKAILLSVHDTIQFFTADSDYGALVDGTAALPGWLPAAYSWLGTVLLVLAPVLTFGFVLSFFEGVTARLTLWLHLPADTYVFSEINDRAVSLAESIRADDRQAIVVFTNMPKDEEKIDDDLLGRVKAVGAVCFRSDISLVHVKRATADKKTVFFTICENEAESISETLQLIRRYKERENAFIYLFSHSVESELILNNVDKGKLKVRRIDPIHSLVNHILETEGHRLFDAAAPAGDGRTITAVVVGLGALGSEMLRALAWYCQMDGYTLNIYGIDKDPVAADRLRAQCPELLDERYNGVRKPGEAFYNVQFRICEAGTGAFRQAIKEIGNITYALVALGDDSLNVSTAVELRVLFEQMHIHPPVLAVVGDAEKSAALTGAADRNGTPYDIGFIADRRTVYSQDVIINSALEQEALALHKRYNNGDEYGFYEFEYNYKSSMASVIHYRAREHCHIAGAGKPESALTPDERDTIEKLEHCRWNAYMRAEGFVYSGSPDRASRNDLGRMHHNLVEFEELSDDDKRKDSRVGAK